MARYRFPRESFFPKGALKVADKASDAVAYIFTDGKDRPRAVMFCGKRDKPDENCYYRDAAKRESAVKRFFESRRASMGAVAKRREEMSAAGPGLVVGDIVNTCWGYEQTNREFFEVIEVRGKMVILREVAQVRTDTGNMTGNAMPQSGDYTGEPIRRLARNGNVKIDDVRYASKWNTSNIAGVPMGRAVGWTSYG